MSDSKPGLSNEEFIAKYRKEISRLHVAEDDTDVQTFIEALDRLESATKAPVAQVEVYRKALEVNANRDHGFRCTYAAGKYSGTVPKCTCGKAEAMEALLTSKPEPVAPVRKWEADDVVGEIVFHESSSVLGDDGERSIDVRVEDLSPEVQDALRGRKA